jgi:hypothetical protein
MAITLSDGTTTINLPAGLQWVNEFSEGRVMQATKRTLAGTVVVSSSIIASGIRIQLESGSDYAWVKKVEVDKLKVFSDQSNLQLTLVFQGGTKIVMFDHAGGKGFEATPIYPFANPNNDTYYRVKLSFFTVQ